MFFKIGVLKNFYRYFPVNIAKFLRTVFLWKTSGSYFFQFDKVTVLHVASALLIFLFKNTIWDGFN